MDADVNMDGEHIAYEVRRKKNLTPEATSSTQRSAHITTSLSATTYPLPLLVHELYDDARRRSRLARESREDGHAIDCVPHLPVLSTRTAQRIPVFLFPRWWRLGIWLPLSHQACLPNRVLTGFIDSCNLCGRSRLVLPLLDSGWHWIRSLLGRIGRGRALS